MKTWGKRKKSHCRGAGGPSPRGDGTVQENRKGCYMGGENTKKKNKSICQAKSVLFFPPSKSYPDRGNPMTVELQKENARSLVPNPRNPSPSQKRKLTSVIETGVGRRGVSTANTARRDCGTAPSKLGGRDRRKGRVSGLESKVSCQRVAVLAAPC